MRQSVPVDDYITELTCTYKDEIYSVRDNGAVLRHPLPLKRQRAHDKQWTFGKPNDKTGYLEIASVRVHGIVTTAFHGPRPTDGHVVDHIDTNKHNNRPENLRWVTRLENVLLNPITAKRIAMVCGSVEAFLADPSKFRDKFPDPNFKWMCTVSVDEAKLSLERMLAWAKSDAIPTGGSLREWIFNRTALPHPKIELSSKEPEQIRAMNINAAQRNWRIPSDFPCCPEQFALEPIKAYAERLQPGLVFCRNESYTAVVFKCAISPDGQSIFVISESGTSPAIKPWSLAQITFENGLFVHTSLHTFFTQEGAEKQFCVKQGLEWTGGGSIDDYC